MATSNAAYLIKPCGGVLEGCNKARQVFISCLVGKDVVLLAMVCTPLRPLSDSSAESEFLSRTPLSRLGRNWGDWNSDVPATDQYKGMAVLVLRPKQALV